MGSKTIIIVEDEALIALLFQRDLSRRGHDVKDIIPTGEAALEWWKTKGPTDIVLMDIQLGGALSGIDTARAMAELHPFTLVFMTGYGSKEVRARAAALHPLAFLEKPVDPRELGALLECV